MKNIIIGTAGHIDHGKTTLIKARPEEILTAGRKSREEGLPLIWALPTLIFQAATGPGS